MISRLFRHNFWLAILFGYVLGFSVNAYLTHDITANCPPVVTK